MRAPIFNLFGDTEYAVAPLPLQRIAQAYPLVHSMNRGVTLEAWVEYASSLVLGEGSEAGSGILAAEQRTGFIAGLVAYRACADLAHGRTLRVVHFIVLSIFDRARIARCLAVKLDNLARALDCGALQTEVPVDEGEGAGTPLFGSDYLLESRVLRKAIATLPT